MAGFEEALFFNEINRFVGSGGEVVVRANKVLKGPWIRMNVGDALIGIGATHTVESLSRPPGPDSFRSFASHTEFVPKLALRAFRIIAKEKTSEGFKYRFSPLSPAEYSSLLQIASNGAAKIEAETIPRGTIIMSFIDIKRLYTLKTFRSSPFENWARVTRGDRHWNVGFARKDDFWSASFPSDRIGLLPRLSPAEQMGSIRFGLSLLPDSIGAIKLRPVKAVHPTGKSTKHDFVLDGRVTGTRGLNIQFPIGLRTEIIFHPIK